MKNRSQWALEFLPLTRLKYHVTVLLDIEVDDQTNQQDNLLKQRYTKMLPFMNIIHVLRWVFMFNRLIKVNHNHNIYYYIHDTL